MPRRTIMHPTGFLPGMDTSDAAKGPQVLLDDAALGCRVTYEPALLASTEASAWMTRLAHSLPLVPEALVMFGKPIVVRRMNCGIGDPGRRYRYSGIERAASPWPEGFAPLLDRLHERTGARFTFALCNLYPDGESGLGWHADDEDDLVRDAPIASLSLGAPRDFAMRAGRNGRACLAVSLAPGSLLVMEGKTQQHYQHRVPPRLRCTEPRLNLTFRVMR